MKFIKDYKIFESESELYFEIDEEEFQSNDITDKTIQNPDKIKALLRDDVIFRIKTTESQVPMDYINLGYDPNKSGINDLKFKVEIFEIDDEWYLVRYEYWKSAIYSYWSENFFKCDQFEGLVQLLQDLNLTK